MTDGDPTSDAAAGDAAGEPMVDAEARFTQSDLLRWSEALAGIAQTGLGFSENLYERERFEEVLAVAADIRVAAGLAHDSLDVVDELVRGIGRGVAGYVTPKVAVAAVVGNDAGELLLVQRADSGVWLYPTGWADVGYSTSEVVVKEVREETGIVCRPTRLLAVLDGFRLGFTRIPMHLLMFHCEATGGELQRHPLECSAVGWFAQENLPWPLAGSGFWVEMAFAAVRGERGDTYFDPPREKPWRD